MDGRAPGDRSVEPAELLRGALEKIVFFECRVSQLESELRAAVKTAERGRTDASAAHQQAVELDAALAGARGARADAERRAEDLAERVRLLEGERERLLAGLVEQAGLAGAPGADGDAAGEQADLAGFIAELRAEIVELRRSSAPGPAAPAAGAREGSGKPYASVATLGGRLASDGRASLTAGDARVLRGQLATESDRVLFDEALQRLRASDPVERLRAVRRLEALGPRAAAPLLAAAVGREPDAEVKVALLGALARVEEPFAADLAAGALEDRRPPVRAAALEALARLAPERAEPRILGALADESPIVRRRGALLLGLSKSPQADEALAAALRDADRGVARAAAAALAGRPSAAAQRALTRALEHVDAGVRRSAAENLGRWSGERVDGEAPDHERRRVARRIAERLAAMGPAEVRNAVMGSAGSHRAPAAVPAASALLVHRFSGRSLAGGGPVAVRVAPSGSPRAPALRPSSAVGSRARAAVAVVEATPLTPTLSPAGTGERENVRNAPPRSPAGTGERENVRNAPPRFPAGTGERDVQFEETIVAELRAALRGRAAADLAGLLAAPPDRVEAALRALASRGAVVMRGPRWYVS
jgi:HEAT repeat protein